MKAAFSTLGCKVNQYESAAIREAIEGKGFEIVPFHAAADVYIINTCTVTAATNYQSRQLIRRAHRTNPEAAVIVTGCYAQIDPEAVAAIPGVVIVAGNAEKEKLADLIAEMAEKRNRAAVEIPPASPSKQGEMRRSLVRQGYPESPTIVIPAQAGIQNSSKKMNIGSDQPPAPHGTRDDGVFSLDGSRSIRTSDILQAKKIAPMPVTRFPEHTRAFLKIQDGCDAFCSYCIVPYARGPERSLPEEAVMEGIARFARAGYREIVLTGIHLGHYGRDLTPPSTLLDLLGRVEREKTVERLRLSSIEALEVTDAMIAFMAEAETVCPHLHIPLQSGDDSVLALMRRNYDTRFFRDLLKKIVQAVPDVAIGLDVMVGFPGEGEEAFENTRRFIEALPVAYLHVFPYSERPGTAAATLPGKVPEGDKKRRAEVLRRLGQAKRAFFAGRFIGRELTVLVEAGKKKDIGGMTGFSGNYIPVVVLSGDANPANQRIRVVPEYYMDGKLFARMIAIECRKNSGPEGTGGPHQLPFRRS